MDSMGFVKATSTTDGYCANSIDDVGCISRASPQLAEHIKKGSVKVGDISKVLYQDLSQHCKQTSQYQLSNEEEDYVDSVSSHIVSSSCDYVPYTGVSVSMKLEITSKPIASYEIDHSVLQLHKWRDLGERTHWGSRQDSDLSKVSRQSIYPPFVYLFLTFYFPLDLKNMSEESGAADVVIFPKFDMQCHESLLSTKYVKILVRKYNVPLDLHPYAPTEGWMMDQLPKDHIGVSWKILLTFVPCLPEFSLGLGLPLLGISWLYPCFQRYRRNVITMPEYLHLPFLSSVFVVQGATFPANHLVKDPKVVAAREKKRVQVARAAAKKKESRKRGNYEDGSSKTKKKKILASANGTLASLNHVSSPVPLWTVAPAKQIKISPPPVEPFVNLSGEPVHPTKEPVFLSETNADRSSHPLNNLSTSDPVPQPREILTGQNIEEGKSSRSASVYIPSKGAMAQTDMLERFENLLANYDALAETHSECLETIQKLVDARLDLKHNAKLYTNAMSHYKTMKEEHDGCEQRIKILENEKNYLSATNDDQATRI
ncbi:hypothetical protein Tco_0134326 [Tanacetum coccineum]